MLNFNSILQKEKDSHAYTLGVQAARDNRSMISPYLKDSELDKEWLDGFLDLLFLRNI